jgi:Fe-S-cluster containining protein
MTDSLEAIYRLLAVLGEQKECRTCRRCEQDVGLVYLLNSEAAIGRRNSLPVLSVGRNAHYLSRTPHGWCSCYDPETNQCRIYAQRPLCCRLYPLDLTTFEGEPWWVAHKDCPITRRYYETRSVDMLIAITIELEQLLCKDDLAGWILQDRVSSSIEAFDYESNRVVRLRRVERL